MKGKPLSQEQKDKMAAGRRAAAARRSKVVDEAIAEFGTDEDLAPEEIIRGKTALPRAEIVYGEGASSFQGTHSDTEAGTDGDIGFRLFLSTLDSETRELLPESELREIYAVQRKAALEEKRASKRKAARDLALNAARTAAGLVPQDAVEAIALSQRNNEPMRMLIELPPTGEHGEIGDIGLRIDQRVLLHGVVINCTRAQFDSYRDIQYRAAEHELLFQGQNIRQRRWLLGRAMGSVNSHIPLNPDGSLAR